MVGIGVKYALFSDEQHRVFINLMSCNIFINSTSEIYSSYCYNGFENDLHDFLFGNSFWCMIIICLHQPYLHDAIPDWVFHHCLTSLLMHNSPNCPYVLLNQGGYLFWMYGFAVNM